MRKPFSKVYLFYYYLIVCVGFVTCGYSQITISTPTISFTQACASSTFNTYNFSFAFFPAAGLGAGNQFIVELSNSTGSFASPVIVKTLTNTTSPIASNFSLPPNTYGDGYRIRVRSTNPVKVSSPSAAFPAYYAVHNLPFSINGNVGTVQLCDGESYTLAIDDTGTPTSPVFYPELTYIWYKDYIEIPGETGSSITVSQPGSYYVVTDYGPCMMNSYSNIVQIQVQAVLNPSITAAGGITTICPGGNRVLTCNIQNVAYTYTWYKDNIAIPASNNSSYTATEEGLYHVTVTAGGCDFDTNAIALDVTDFDLMLDPFPEEDIIPGETITLTAITDAVAPQIEWYKDNILIPGETGLTLDVTQPGDYKVIVLEPGVCNVTKESTVTLTYPLSFNLAVQTELPYVACTSTAVSLSILQFDAVLPGGPVNLIGNSYGYTYQWYRNGVAVAGGSTVGLTVTNSALNGSYTLRVTIPGFGVVTSNAVLVDLAIPPVTISGSTILCPAGTVTLSSGTTNPSYSYQWFKDGAVIPGATSPAYIANATGSYYLQLTGGACMVQSNTITLVPASISVSSTNPAVDLILPGQTKPLTVTTTANTPAYSWERDGAPIAGTSPTYNATQDGQYVVSVTQTVGCNITEDHTFILEYPTGFNVVIAPVTAYTACSSATVTLGITNFIALTPSGPVTMTDLGYSYQWYLDGVAVPGGTSQTLTVNNAVQNGEYSLGITMPDFAMIFSNDVVINLPIPPVTISGSTILCAGGNVAFTSNVSNPAHTYQWYKDTVLIPGATSPSYTANATGSYYLVVSNGSCATQSNTITVVPAAITVSSTNPAVDLILPGQTKPLTVTTTANTPFYSWEKDGAAIAGNSATYNATQDGQYIVSVTQTVGCNITEDYTFILEYPTGFTVAIGPVTAYTACSSATATLGITSFIAQTPSGPVTMTDLGYGYQWYLDGVPVPGATSQTLTLNNASQNGEYSLGITMPDFAMILSNDFVINLPIQPVTISGSTILCEGSTVSLSSNVTNPAHAYQWYKDTVMIPGANSPSYIANAAGAYYLVVSNGSCATQSNTITINLDDIVINSTTPALQLILPGETKTLTVTTNANTPQYTWTRNGLPIGTNSPTLNATQDGVYVVQVMQTVGCNTTETRTFTLEYPTGFTVTIIANSSYIPCVSPSATLNVSSFIAQTPSGPVNMTNLGYSYQWYRDGVAVPGANATILSINSATQNGSYSLSITMPDFPAVFSNSIPVSLNVEPVTISSSGLLCEGGTILLSSNVTNPGYTYQWYKDTVLIPGATGTTYTADTAGSYYLRVSNVSCTRQSNTLPIVVETITVSSTLPAVDVIIPGAVKILSVTTSAVGPIYEWYLDGVLLPNNTSTLNATEDGVYTVHVTQTVGCPAEAELTFTLEYPIDFDVAVGPVSSYTACTSSSITLGITTFTAQTPSGTVPMTDMGYGYQWYLGSNPVPGATSQTLTLNSASQNGLYSLAISMPDFAVIFSNSFAVNLGIPSGSVTVTSSGALCSGDTVLLSSSVTGGSYTYQWFKDGIAISGETASTYTANAIGDYYVQVSSGSCMAQSNTIPLTISGISVSSTTPVVDVILPGQVKVLTITTNAAGPQYAWYLDGILLPAETAATLNATQDGAYHVVVTQTIGCNATASYDFTLGYPTSFTISIGPGAGYAACVSTAVTLDVTSFIASTSLGDIPMTDLGYAYQWYLNGSPVPGATSPTITINNAAQNGVYRLGVVMPGFSELLSNIFTVNLSVGPITIVSDGLLCIDDPIVTVSADLVNPAYTYTWYRDGVSVSTGNSATYDASVEGDYFVTINTGICLFTSNTITVEESDFDLTPNSPLTDVIIQGENKTLSVTTDALLPTFVWYRNNVIIPGANTNSVYVTLDGEYKVVVTQTQECTISKELIFTLVYPSDFDVVIAANADFEQCQDMTATLDISLFNAIGPSGPIDILGNNFGYQYQWYKDNIAIGGATGTTYNVNESGDYSLRVTIPIFGEAISNTLTITLGFIDEVVIESDGFFCAEGTEVEITSSVNENDYSYRWYREGSGSAISTDTSVTVSEPGNYYLEVSYQNCTVTSNILELVPYDLSQITIIGGEIVDLPEGTTTIVTAEGAESYEWYLNGVLVSNDASVEIEVDGVYTLVATVGECEVTKELNVNKVENKVIAIPNLITPNGDGKNEQWALPLKYLNNDNIEVTIYGPDGTIVFRQSNYMNNWPESGFTYSLKNPVYYYVIMEGTEIIKRGSITIVE